MLFDYKKILKAFHSILCHSENWLELCLYKWKMYSTGQGGVAAFEGRPAEDKEELRHVRAEAAEDKEEITKLQKQLQAHAKNRTAKGRGSSTPQRSGFASFWPMLVARP